MANLKTTTILLLLFSIQAIRAAAPMQGPIGFYSAVSRSERGKYASLSGQINLSDSSSTRIMLLSDGEDISESLRQAVEQYDVVLLNGIRGPFVVSHPILLTNLRGKTIIGLNGATIRTRFYISDSIHSLLDSAHVNDLPTNGGGGTLPNGMAVREEREYTIRKVLYEHYHDSLETYRESGIFSIRGCENIVLRNLRLVGPGALDVGGSDLISCVRTTHLWVDHCELVDGMDGNFDITQQSDFISVTWCRFRYTERSYDHCYSNLICASDRQVKDSLHLNVTFAYCLWDEGCEQRMPMVRYGKIHVLNCYFRCPGAMRCINARKQSEVLVEGCYAEDGVENFFVDGGSAAYTLRGNRAQLGCTPRKKGKVSVPYPYTILPARKVKQIVGSSAGVLVY